MTWLWHYLIGFLTIKIYGSSSEILLNKAAKQGVKIWNLSYSKGTITGNIHINNFKKLRCIKRKTNCKIKIIKKHGIRFFCNKYKNRLGFIVGMLIFGIILYTLSNFIWIINVEGNNRLTTQNILISCKKIGIYEGIKKSKIHSKYDSQRLQLTMDDIAWCSFNVEGSVLTVNLSEVAISDKEERKIPSNIKASFDGKIKKIDVTSGNTVVKVGDVVSKGDLLVSGVVENLSSTLFVHSDGVITAETTRTFSAKGDYIQKKLIKQNDTFKRYSISFFNIKMPLYLGNIKKRYNYNINVNYLTLFNKKIPIKIGCENFEFLYETTVVYNKETLENLLYNNIKKQLKKFNFISATELKKEIIESEKGILINITYNCEENIVSQDEIILDTQN